MKICLNHHNLVVFLGMFFFCSLALGSHLPKEFEATYEVKKGFIKIGDAKRTLKRKGKSEYTYTSHSKTTGMVGFLLSEKIVQTTTFRYKNYRPQPLTYHYDRSGRNGYQVHQRYDWEKQHVYVEVDGDRLSYDTPSGSQDQSVYQLALMLDLAHGKRNMTYNIAENRRLKTYDIRHIKDQTVETIYGDMQTVVVKHQNKNNSTTLWCAKSLFYLPVKIEYLENGIKFTAYLTNLEGLASLSKVEEESSFLDF